MVGNIYNILAAAEGGFDFGLLECILAGLSIIVDVGLVFLAARLAKQSERREAKLQAKEAIEVNSVEDTTSDVCTADSPDNKLKKKMLRVIKKLEKENPELKFSAVALVITLKDLYGGDESFVVKLLKGAKQNGFLMWDGDSLRTGTVITIDKSKENDLVDYFSSRKPG